MWMLLLRSSLTMDCQNIYFVVFGLSLLTLQCALTQSLSGPGRTVCRVHGYPPTLTVPHTGYPSTLTVPHTGYPPTLTVPHTGYPSTLTVPHTGYPSTLTVPHTGYASTLTVPHTGYPSILPVPHTDSTRLCHTSEKLLSLITTLPPSVDVSTVQSVSPDSSLSSWIPYLSSFLRQRLYEHGIHCRQLPSSPRRPKKMRPYSVGRGGRGRRRISVLTTTTYRQPPSSCRSGWDFCSLVSVSVISGSDPCCRMPKDELRIALLYAQSYGSPSALKCTEIAEFVTDNDVDLIFLSETLLEQESDVGQCDEVTPAGCSMRSFPRPSRCGGLAVAFRDSLAVASPSRLLSPSSTPLSKLLMLPWHYPRSVFISSASTFLLPTEKQAHR